MSKPLTYPANRNYEKGVADERERIIKLLEEQKKIYTNWKFSTTGGLIEGFVLEESIARIKGENK